MAEDNNVKLMSAFAAGLVVLAVVTVVGIIVLAEFKTSIDYDTQNGTQPNYINDTIDLFIAGLAVFGSFATILALILIAKVILKLLKGGLDS